MTDFFSDSNGFVKTLIVISVTFFLPYVIVYAVAKAGVEGSDTYGLDNEMTYKAKAFGYSFLFGSLGWYWLFNVVTDYLF
jgi:hypothetical protein